MYVIGSTSGNWTSSYQRLCSIGNLKFYAGGSWLGHDCIYRVYYLFRGGWSSLALEAMSSLFPQARNVRQLNCSHIVKAKVKWGRKSMKRNVPNLGLSNPWRDFPRAHTSKAFFSVSLDLCSTLQNHFQLSSPLSLAAGWGHKLTKENDPILWMWMLSPRMLTWLGSVTERGGGVHL